MKLRLSYKVTESKRRSCYHVKRTFVATEKSHIDERVHMRETKTENSPELDSCNLGSLDQKLSQRVKVMHTIT